MLPKGESLAEGNLVFHSMPRVSFLSNILNRVHNTILIHVKNSFALVEWESAKDTYTFFGSCETHVTNKANSHMPF